MFFGVFLCAILAPDVGNRVSMHDLSDGVLLRRFVEDDSQEAFEALVVRYERLVLGVARRVLGNAPDAEDAAQATFIALALKAGRLDASAGLGGWLHRVARQVSLDLLKAQARRREWHREAMPPGAAPAPCPGSGAALDEAIVSLPEKLRHAIVGHYLEGFSLEELALRHRCTPSAISMRLTRGREALRRRLGGKRLLEGALVTAVLEQAGAPDAFSAGFAAATARLVVRSKIGVAATEAAAATLFELARKALARSLFAQLKWAGAAGAVAVATLATAVIAQLPGAAPDVRPASAAAATATAPAAVTAAPAAIRKEEPADPPLIAALKNGRYRWEEFSKVKALMDAVPGPIDAIRDASGKTALHWTVIRGWDDLCTLALLKGANVDAVDNQGRTALFEAIDRGDTCAKLLLLRGADINHAAADGSTPLSRAVRAGRIKEAEMLLWLGADVRPKGAPIGEQPLTLAETGGNGAMLELLKDYDAPDSPTLTNQPQTMPGFVKNAFQLAAETGDFDQLNALLRGGININVPDGQGRTAMHRAIRGAQPDVVLYLLMLSASPNAVDRRGTTPLMQTMGWLGGELDGMRRYLILKGANPFASRPDGFNELTWAVERDNEHGVQWLLWLGANGREITKRGTPFQMAFKGGHQRIMDLFRRNGIDDPIQLSDDPVWNLHNAVRRGDHELVVKLLAQGVPVDAPDPSGASPLIMAIATRNVPTARLLIEKGADLHFRNAKNGVTPLIQTMCWDYGEMTEFREDLLKAGADPNAADNRGKTVLMGGIWFRPTMPLKQLIEYGADLNRRNNDGLTALGIALKERKFETAEYLRSLGATE